MIVVWFVIWQVDAGGNSNMLPLPYNLKICAVLGQLEACSRNCLLSNQLFMLKPWIGIHIERMPFYILDFSCTYACI